MNRWRERIELGNVFHDDSMEFNQRRDTIIDRIRKSRWFTSSSDESFLTNIVDELANTQSEQEFNYVWNDVYDQADLDRVWIETFLEK